jgi:hypothetical protein
MEVPLLWISLMKWSLTTGKVSDVYNQVGFIFPPHGALGTGM